MFLQFCWWQFLNLLPSHHFSGFCCWIMLLREDMLCGIFVWRAEKELVGICCYLSVFWIQVLYILASEIGMLQTMKSFLPKVRFCVSQTPNLLGNSSFVSRAAEFLHFLDMIWNCMFRGFIHKYISAAIASTLCSISFLWLFQDKLLTVTDMNKMCKSCSSVFTPALQFESLYSPEKKVVRHLKIFLTAKVMIWKY